MKQVVVGVANSETADRAARHAAELARALDATLHMVSTVSDHSLFKITGAGESWTFTDADLAREHLATLKVALGNGLEITSSVIDGEPAKTLCDEAERLGADVIVVGSVRTHGLGRVLGSIAGDVLKCAPCAVHVAQTD